MLEGLNSRTTLSFANTKLTKIINILKSILNRFYYKNILKYLLIFMFFLFKVTILFVKTCLKTNQQSYSKMVEFPSFVIGLLNVKYLSVENVLNICRYSGFIVLFVVSDAKNF